MPQSSASPDIFDDVAGTPSASSTDIFDQVSGGEPEKPKTYLPEVNKAVASVPKPDSPLNYAVPGNDVTGGVTGFFPEKAPRNGPRAQLPATPPLEAVKATLEATPPQSETPLLPGASTEVSAAQHLATPGKRWQGATEAVQGAGEAVTPFMGPAATEMAAVPELAPALKFATGLGVGIGGQPLAEKGAEKLGASPEQQQFWGELAFWAPQIAGLLASQVKGGVDVTPEGTRASISTPGGKVGAGVAVTPESVTVRGKVGPLEGSKTFQRGGGQQPGQIEAPTIEGQPPAAPGPPPPSDDPAITSMANAHQAQTTAAKQAAGIPEPPPPTILDQPNAPPELKENRIAPESITRMASFVAGLPDAQRAQAVQEAHQTLTAALTEMGKKGPVSMPDGTLALVKDPKSAEKLAISIINDAVKAHDKVSASLSGEGERGKQTGAVSPKEAASGDIFDQAAQNPTATEKPSPAGQESQQPLKKGDTATLARDIDINGKTLAKGTPVTLTYVHPNGLLARATTEDGTKISRGVGAFTKGVTNEPSKQEENATSVQSAGQGGNAKSGRDSGQGEAANNIPRASKSGESAGTVANKQPEPKVAEPEHPNLDLGEHAAHTEMVPTKTVAEYGKDVEMLPVEELEKLATHDRRKEPFGSDMDELKADIQKNGIKEPLELGYNHAEKKAVIWDGNHRLGVAKELGLKELPVRVKATDFPTAKYGKEVAGYKGEGTVPERLKPSDIGIGARPVKTEAKQEEKPTKYKFGNTQAPIPAGSEAATALKSAQDRIAASDLAGKGKETDPHVTVRYGIKTEDTKGIREFLSKQAPFEAKLGKTDKFPPSEHSEGAAVIIAPIEAPELHRLNAELEKHGEFTEPSFKEYRPHATIAYVDPEKAGRYTGMSVTDGKKFTVDKVYITDRNGNAEAVKLEGTGAEVAEVAERPPVSATVTKPAAPDLAAMGKKAFEAGKMRVPSLDPELMEAIKGVSVTDRASALGTDAMLKQWLKGWDQANLAEGYAPAEGLTSEPTIKAEANAERTDTAEGRREVPAAESNGGRELERAPAETGTPAREERNPPAETGRGGRASDRDNEPSPQERPSAGPGEGASVREPSPAERTSDSVKTPKLATKNKDWFAHPEDFSVDATESKRLEWNVSALKVLKSVIEKNEKLTDEGRDALAHYVGWGALQWAFDPYGAPSDQQRKWIEASRELRELMTAEDLDAARRSTQNAHYTSPQLVRFVWSALQRMGFKGGVVLEPSMGTGNFFGMMPKAMRGASQGIGNELDPTTYNIAKLLYPSATTFNKDFVELMLPNDSIDLAVSNVPFGVKVYDKNYPNLKASIHDYFFMKSLDKVRPGGVVSFITSTFSLDKQRADIREVLADKGDLLFALRFPQDTFAKSAGTAVATDLIFLRKRIPGEEPKGEPFLALRDVQAKYNTRETGKQGEGTQQINEYFAAHPENVLGELEIGRGRTTSNPETLVVKRPDNFEELLKKALDRVPRNSFLSKRSAAPLLRADTDEAFASDDLEEGNYALDKKGNPVQRENGKLVPTNAYLDKEGKPSPILKDRLTRLIGIRDATRELMREMRTLPDEPVANKQIEKMQLKLAIEVKEYQKKHGYFAERKTKDVFQDDPHYPLILSLEDYDKPTKVGTPAPILSKRTIYPEARLTSLSADPKEALYQVLGERGRPDIEFMSGLSGKSEEEIAAPLVKQGLIFREPVTGEWQTRAKYLSGYVREKLVDAKTAVAQGQKEYARNVEELEKVQPATVPINSGDPAKDIQIKLGATWIAPPVVQQFLKEVLKASWGEVKYADGMWKVENVSHTAEVTGQFSGGGMTADKLIELALNQKQPVVKDVIRDGDSTREVVNVDKTIAAKRAQQKVREEFAKWARSHKTLAPQLEKIYNEKMNNLVTPQHDGSHMIFPGMNKSVLRDGKLMPHQTDAVWKIVEDGRALLAHVVGAGKTYEMIAAAMELKRLGRIRKPLFAVPNHLVGQWAADFLKLYPGAKLLVPDKKDFESVRRNKIMSRIATGDWDAIILPHSQFNLMDISAERQRVTLEKELDELEEAYRHAKASEGKRGYTVKRLEKAKDRLRAKIAELSDMKADKTIRFDDTGVDQLFIDEAHAYKNLAFYTKMERVAGLAQGDSKRATRLKMKTDYLLEKHGNRGVVFATGTPIQNTMAEMYNMIKYLAPDALQKAGIKYFDDWAANFGEVITAMELGVDGRTYKPRSKFSRFTNVPELQMMFRSFADVKTKEDLNLPVPEVEGGKPQALTATPTPELEQYVRGLINRAKILRGEGVPVVDADGKPVMVDEYKEGKPTGKKVQALEYHKRPDPRIDNMLKLTGDGRKAATDLRLIDPDYPDDPQSKINKVVDKVFEEWETGRRDTRVIDPATDMPLERLTGAVFLDNYQFLREVGGEYAEDGSVTKKGKEEVLLNLYRDMADKLVAKGVPRKEIAIIHDYAKQEQKTALFQAMNKGEVRVLFGSTEKMGAGMNAQERMKYLIDVDSPWRPGDLEQRHGRIIRQGNKNKSVRIYHAVTKGTFDSYMIQTLKGKAEFINQVMSGKFTGRTMTDAAGDMVLSLEEMLAASSNNPDVKKKMELEAEVATLQALEREHEAQMYKNKRNAESERDNAARFETNAAAWKLIQQDWTKATEGDKFTLKILGKTFDKYGDANDWIKDQHAPVAPFHFELNGIPMRFEMMNRGEHMEPLMGYYVGPFSTPRTIDSFASLITSAHSYLLPKHVESRMRDAEQGMLNATEKADKLERLSEKSGFEDADRLKKAQEELETVKKRLGLSDEQAAEQQDVAADVDSSPDGPEEIEEPEESTLRRLAKEETGELDVSKLGEVVSNFYQQDVAKGLGKAGIGLREVPALFARALYPRIEESNPIGRALGVAAPADAVDALMKVQGDRAKALAEFDLVLNGVEKMFDRLPDDARIDFIDRIQTGKKQANSNLEDLAAAFTKIMDAQRAEEQEAANLGREKKAPIELSKKANYFHNWWDTRPGKEPEEEEGERISRLFTPKRPLEGTKGYNRRQSYTIKSGIEAGGEPVTTNPVRILRHRIEDGMKFVTARRAWNQTQELGLRQYVRKGAKRPAGFDKIDDKIAKVYFPAFLEFPGMEEPMQVAHEIGEWYVEANTARLLNNMLSVDKIRRNPVGRGLMWLKNASTALELGLSPFHAVFESIEAMSSMLSLGMQRAYNQGIRQGKPGELAQGIKEMVSSPAAPITLAREGAALPAYIEARARLGKIGLTEFGHVISGEQPHGVLEALKQFQEVRKEKAVQRLIKQYPDLDQLVDDMFQGGLVIGQHRDYQVKALGKTAAEAFSEGNPIGAVWRAIPTLTQGVMYPLFNWYIPNLKYSLFLKMMSEAAGEHARELDSGELTRATLARRVADSVENRFGELNFDNLFLNRTTKTALQFLFRSMTYKLGTVREFSGAGGGQLRELGTWAKDAADLLGGGGGGKDGGKKTGEAGFEEEPEGGKTFGEKALPRLDSRAAWVTSLMIVTAMLGTIAAKLLTKKYPWQWISDDEKEGMSAEAAMLLEVTHPRTGEFDSRGKPVRISLPTYWKDVEHAAAHPAQYVLSSLSGIVSKLIDTAENKDYFGNYVYNPSAPLGTKLKQAGKYNFPMPFVASNFLRGQAQNQTKTAWLSAFGFPKAPSDLDFTPAEKAAQKIIKEHESPATPEELEAWREKRQAFTEGKLPLSQARAFMKRARESMLQRQLKNSAVSYSDARKVYELATPEEKKSLEHIMYEKRSRLLREHRGGEVKAAESSSR